MNYKPFLTLTIAAAFCPAVFAQKPLSEADLLKQIESLTPAPPAAARTNNPPASLFDTSLGDPLKLGTDKGDKKDKAPDKADDKSDKDKGPTVITALEATFDQKANLAIFIGEVVVKDPEFNVICDKLTAHLKHDDKPKVAPGATPGTPKPVTPGAKPATPGPKGNDAAANQKGSALEKALAETTSDRRVIITQDKMEADGSITHSIGKSDRATYNGTTGDVVLYGSPDVIQGTNHVQATEASTVMTINRDGHMKAVGPHKTTIIDTSRQATPAPADGSTPRPVATPRL